jgi:hypothetical protein
MIVETDHGAGPGLERGIPLADAVEEVLEREPSGNGRGDPQAALIDRLSEDDLLDALGPRYDRDSVLRIERAAEPRVLSPQVRTLAQLLMDPDALKPPAIVAPVIANRAQVTLVAGREKLSGKSTFVTAAAAGVTRGGLFLGEPCLSAHVLFVSADQEHGSIIAQRAMRFGADPDRLHVLWPRAGLNDVLAAVELVHPGWVIIDTLSNYATGLQDPHSSAEWPAVLMPLVSLAREREIAITVPHHATKGQDSGYRDSTAIGACVDMIVTLHPVPDSPARRRITCLGRWPARDLVVELVGDAYSIVQTGQLGSDAQVLAFIAQHPGCSKNTLRTSLGMGREPIDRAVDLLLERKAIENRGAGRAHQYHAVEAAREREPGEDNAPF